MAWFTRFVIGLSLAAVLIGCSDDKKKDTTTKLDGGLDASLVRNDTAVAGSCAGMTCETPPVNTCNGTFNLAIFASRGFCDQGECKYAFREEACEAGACANGICSGTPCQGVTCDTPPAAECINGSTLRVYNAQGHCSDVAGQPECGYFSNDVTCLQGCANGQCLEDPCAHVSCDSPPARYCDGNDLVVWDTVPRCDVGECVYNTQRVSCGPSGCVDGHCAADDVCANVVCDTPPANRCLDGTILRVYDNSGSCEEGACLFTHQDHTCQGGCAGGQCADDACIGVSCDKAPGTRCKDASALMSWDGLTGACTNGVCSYGVAETPCAAGCVQGQCTGNPCAGVHCLSPPGDYCRDATSLVTFPAMGTCDPTSGSCAYPLALSTCPAGCDMGSCIGDNTGGTDTGLDSDTALGTDTGTEPMDTEPEGECPALEVISFTEGTITGDVTWEPAIYELSRTLTIEQGTLTVQPCTIIKVDSSIVVGENGALTMIGSAARPITVTSTKPVAAAGDWNNISIDAAANNAGNVFEHVIVEYGGSGTDGSVLVKNGASLSMSNSTVRHSGHYGIELANGGHLENFTGNTITLNAEGAVAIGADSVDDLGPGTYTGNLVEGIYVKTSSTGPVLDDATWLNLGVPYILSDYMLIETGTGSARLTVSAGTVIKMNPGDNISVRDNGGLTLAGTPENPVTVTCSKSVCSAGDWGHIEITDASVDAYNVFTHAIVEYGGGGGEGAVWVRSGASLSMTDSTVHHSLERGVEVENDGHLVNFTGNTITENALGAVLIAADSVKDLGEGTYTGNIEEGITIKGVGATTVASDAVWLNHGVPYITTYTFDIANSGGSAHLTLSAGIVFKVYESGIRVRDGGALTLDGTPDNPITVTCAKPTCAPGDWNEIQLEDGSVKASNVFKNATIEYGGGGSYGHLRLDNGAGVTLENVIFSNTGSEAGCDIVDRNAVAGETITLVGENNLHVLCE